MSTKKKLRETERKQKEEENKRFNYCFLWLAQGVNIYNSRASRVPVTFQKSTFAFSYRCHLGIPDAEYHLIVRIISREFFRICKNLGSNSIVEHSDDQLIVGAASCGVV